MQLNEIFSQEVKTLSEEKDMKRFKINFTVHSFEDSYDYKILPMGEIDVGFKEDPNQLKENFSNEEIFFNIFFEPSNTFNGVRFFISSP